MGGDLLMVLIAHPITHALVTTVDRQLVELEYDVFDLSPVYKLCDTVKRRMHVRFAIVYLRKVFQELEGVHNFKVLLLFEVDRGSSDFGLPSNLTWTPMQEAKSIIGKRAQKSVSIFLSEYSNHGLNGSEGSLYPYSRTGWFELSREWMSMKLKMSQNEEVVAVNQFTLTSQGSVLCATTRNKRKYYMKAVAPKGMNEEAVVSCALANVFPDKFQKPIAVDFGEKWIIMRDYGVPLEPGDCFVNSKSGSQLMRKILLEWSVLQKRSISKKSELEKLGVPVWYESYVVREVERMTKDPVWYEMQKKGMDKDELLRFGDESEYKQSYLAYVERLFRKLDDFQVPLTLVHGDLNPANIAVQDDETLLFFDFALTCISVPFIDAIRFVSVCDGTKEDLGFYLHQWTEFENMDRLWGFLDVVDDLDGVFSLLILYHAYLTSEKVVRDAAREELSFGVWDTFGKYH